MRKFFHLFSFFILLLVLNLVSCKPSLPSEIISEGKMEDILYDYHVVQAAAEQGGEPSINSRVYKNAVLKEYGVTEAEFDSSMVYYSRHTELLHDIYENLQERLKNEAEQLGSSVSDMNKFGGATSKGDTADIWNGDKSFVLSATQPFNLQSFYFTADTSFHKGARIMLDFNTQFIFQDGMRDGLVMLAVKFKNDSVAQKVTHINNSQSYMLTVEDNDSIGVKEIKGFFMLGKGNNLASGSTTMKLMFITNIRLYRMNVKREEKQDNQPLGTVRVPGNRVEAVRSNDSAKGPNVDNLIVPAKGDVNIAPDRKPVIQKIRRDELKTSSR